MDLADLVCKINKLIFLNKLFIVVGVESMGAKEALYVLEDEIDQLETIYLEVKEQLEQCF